MAETTTQAPEFGSSNSWLVDEMYRDYLENPESVGESWQEFFSDYRPVGAPKQQAGDADGSAAASQGSGNGAPTPRPAAEGDAGARTDEGARRPDASKAAAPPETDLPAGAKQLRGAAKLIAENMAESLEVPTATSIRVVPAKLLEVNRRILNNQLQRTRGGKLSFTHLIGWALVKAFAEYPAMTHSYAEADGKGHVVVPEHVNLGLAVDVQKGDGSRTLLVPNIKGAGSLDFAGFYHAYEQLIRKVKTNKLSTDMFEGTTSTLTNPGTVGTVGSVPRLMQGQSVIVGVGAIDYPAEYHGADPATLATLGVGKVITVTSTYDHRVIQGAESGLFLKRIHELLVGEHGFYDEIFSSLEIPYVPVKWHADEGAGVGRSADDLLADKQVAISQLINAYRVRGHLTAHLNPLAHTYVALHPELDPATHGLTIWDLDREFATGGLAGKRRMLLGKMLGVLRDAYCRTVGVEYMHISNPEEKSWIQDAVEGVDWRHERSDQLHILEGLNSAEAFERFLHTKYLGSKRFSLEGAESTIPMLDALLSAAADDGIGHAVLGMAHRGRLNVLSNILHKSNEKIFREFEGDVDPNSVQGSGDVKYHLGASGKHDSPAGNTIELTLSSNPSHLEAVDGVVEGMARALLDDLGGDGSEWPILPVLVHGDAAFAGQGVVAETFTMSQLRGFRTGGTVHLVINNQLGFTTAPDMGRSSTYATDVAKAVQAPIFHVNGDDPEACVRVMRLAYEFRQAFAKDVVVDLVCYRRWGHNEGDEPSYTQPLMYAAIEERRSVRKVYTEELVTRGDISVEEAEQALDSFRSQLEQTLDETRESKPPQLEDLPPAKEIKGVLEHVETGVARGTLDEIVAAITSWPEGFQPHPKLARQLEKRRGLLDDDAVDWAMGEALAFGSLVLEGHNVRLAGQDSRRGTFSQRHSVLIDHTDAGEHNPLAALASEKGSGATFSPYDSLLSEYAAMAFEYGYSVIRRDALVAWEGQFGDFVNGGQIVIDQFITSAEEKWGQRSGLVLLLPHGYEGQGPEHSSARIERFLTLCAQDNIQVVQPSTAAQYFHVLRRQLHRDVRKPLVVITPKGMLRAKPATSPASALTSGSFQEVLGEPDGPAAGDVRRVILCSGKIAHQLRAERDELEAPVAIVRVEQLYPFPTEQIAEAVEGYGEIGDVAWVQDEPENMGPWPFVHERLHKILRGGPGLKHIARRESASPASGSHTIHDQEERDLHRRALEELAA